MSSIYRILCTECWGKFSCGVVEQPNGSTSNSGSTVVLITCHTILTQVRYGKFIECNTLSSAICLFYTTFNDKCGYSTPLIFGNEAKQFFQIITKPSVNSTFRLSTGSWKWLKHVLSRLTIKTVDIFLAAVKSLLQWCNKRFMGSSHLTAIPFHLWISTAIDISTKNTE